MGENQTVEKRLAKRAFFSVTGTNFFKNHGEKLTVGTEVELVKNKNEKDDESIVININGNNVGYVANSVANIPNGCYSAGRLYDKFDKTIKANIVISYNESIIIGEVLLFEDVND